MKKHCIVFDFDGTLADSEATMIKIYEYFAALNGRPKLDKKTKQRLKDGTTRKALKWSGVRFWQVPKLLNLARSEYKKDLREIKLFTGVKPMLNKLSKNYDLYILSSNSEHTVKRILRLNGLNASIKILKGSSIFGKDKALKKLIKENGYERNKCWMIGDEMRDIIAGNKAKMNTIAVTWGLQSEKGVSQGKPDHVAKEISEINKIIFQKNII